MWYHIFVSTPFQSLCVSSEQGRKPSLNTAASLTSFHSLAIFTYCLSTENGTSPCNFTTLDTDLLVALPSTFLNGTSIAGFCGSLVVLNAVEGGVNRTVTAKVADVSSVIGVMELSLGSFNALMINGIGPSKSRDRQL